MSQQIILVEPGAILCNSNRPLIPLSPQVDYLIIGVGIWGEKGKKTGEHVGATRELPAIS